MGSLTRRLRKVAAVPAPAPRVLHPDPQINGRLTGNYETRLPLSSPPALNPSVEMLERRLHSQAKAELVDATRCDFDDARVLFNGEPIVPSTLQVEIESDPEPHIVEFKPAPEPPPRVVHVAPRRSNGLRTLLMLAALGSLSGGEPRGRR